MRTLLFNNIEGRACDTPGCSERWGECKKHGTLSAGARPAFKTRPVRELPESRIAGVEIHCARCGYHVCNCARRALPNEVFDYIHPVHGVKWCHLNDTAVKTLLDFHSALVDGKRQRKIDLGGDHTPGVDSPPHEYGFRWSSGGPDPKNIRKDLDSGIFRAGRAQIERFNGQAKRVAGLDYEAIVRGHLSYWTDDRDIFRLWLDRNHIRLSSDTRKDHRVWGLASFDLAHAERMLRANGFTKVENLETRYELWTASDNFNIAYVRHKGAKLAAKRDEYPILTNFGPKVFDSSWMLLPDQT